MKAVIYCRADGDALDRELAALEAVHKSLGWEEPDVYLDTAGSNFKSRNEMLGDIRAGGIDAIVVWGLDRLARTPTDLGAVLLLCRAGGVENIITGSTGEVHRISEDGALS